MVGLLGILHDNFGTFSNIIETSLGLSIVLSKQVYCRTLRKPSENSICKIGHMIAIHKYKYTKYYLTSDLVKQ